MSTTPADLTTIAREAYDAAYPAAYQAARAQGLDAAYCEARARYVATTTAAAAVTEAVECVPLPASVLRDVAARAVRMTPAGTEPGSLDALEAATEYVVRRLDAQGYAFTVEQVQDAINGATA